jgi:hypothetical protein
MAGNWAVMLPPGTRAMKLQFASVASGGTATITQEPTSSPAYWPAEKSWS